LIVTPKNFTCASFTPVAAVSGTKTASGTFAQNGNVTYTIVLTNNGSATQADNTGPEFTDVLPSQLSLVSASATSGTAVATTGTNTVTWDGSIPLLGGSVTITIQATVKPTSGGLTASNQGNIAFDGDGNGTNEAAAVTDDPATETANDPTVINIACPTITVSPASLPGGTFGSAYSQTLTASGGNGAYTFAVLSGSLPGGLTLDAGGTLSGTPTVPGSFPVTIKATDANGCIGSTAYTLVIAKAATATAVTSSLNPSGLGQSVTFTATVTSGAGTPTGTVQFKDNGINLGAPVSLSGGVATLTTSTLIAGNHPITADYSGDGSFAISTGTLSGGQQVAVVIFRFSATTYNTNESSRLATITVVRLGDPSVAANVDYETPDDSSATPTILPCASVGGSATARCDFTTSIGTLKFAANEISKTFDVLISQDNYVEGLETLSLTLSNPTNGAIVGPGATLAITDDVTEPAGNPIDDSTNFVRQHYHDFLNREPDPNDLAGLAFWTNQIESCGPDPTCRDIRRQNVSAAFFVSVEFQQTGYYVYRIYKAAFGDINSPTVPVPVRYREFLRDTQEVQKGVIVGQGAWQAQIDANKQAYAVAFVKRPEFITAYPLSLSATAFVDKMNTNTGGVLTPSERTALINQLSANPTDSAVRGDVLMKIAENAALKQQEMNKAFVLMQYIGYLRRNPDAAPEAGLSFAGYNFWLNKLNSFGGNFITAEMVKAFILSGEYRARF
jgi:uncharacterized repeat protein (TIGR01451 family)